MLIDTHCHLNFKAFKGKIGQVVAEAKKAGVEKIVVPGANRESSKKAIELAEKLKLPLIVHNRQASEDVLKILNSKFLILNSCVFHCFQGNDELLDWALEHNFYIGITGIITYDKEMQLVVKKIPLEKLLIETDSPFLTPEALRSHKIFPNTPKNVRVVYHWVAKIKNISFEETERQTTENAIRLFNI